MITRLMQLFIIVLMTAGSLYAQSASKLSAQQFNEGIKSNHVIVLDVRTPKEFEDGYIPNAKNIDYNDDSFREAVKTLDKNSTYYVYCLSGGRSHSAIKYLKSKGFKQVYELDGGILKWTYPLAGTEKSDARPDAISMEDYNAITTSERIVVVDFYAPWCGPCQKMKPMLEELAAEYKGKASVVRINIDENKRLMKALNLSEIPVVKIYKGGKETWNRVGMTEKKTIVGQLKAL